MWNIGKIGQLAKKWIRIYSPPWKVNCRFRTPRSYPTTLTHSFFTLAFQLNRPVQLLCHRPNIQKKIVRKSDADSQHDYQQRNRDWGGYVVNIPIYSPFSFIIYSLNYFPDIFSILLFKLCYLEATDIFLHFSQNASNMFRHIRKFPPQASRV